MGVDLATYRARIGTFISRRNVSDDDERRRIVRAMWRTKNLSKAMVTTNLKYNITSGTHSLEKPIHICSSIAFGFLPTLQHVRPSGYSGLRLYAVAERFALTLVAMSFILIKQLLLLLSGDVETNPGPLGQHTEGEYYLSEIGVKLNYTGCIEISTYVTELLPIVCFFLIVTA